MSVTGRIYINPGIPVLIICLLVSGCIVKNGILYDAGIALPLEESMIIKLSVRSRHTGRNMPFNVYLPAGYGEGENYPVWYGLHGYGGSESMWIEAGITESADALIRTGRIEPIVMVFPFTRDATIQELQKDAADDGKFGERTMDRFVCEELIPYIDSRFQTVRTWNGRYIGGFSMGGAIALRIAFHHPELFGKAGGYSPAVTSSDFSGTQLEGWLFPNDNTSRIRDVVQFARKKKLDRLVVYLDAGNNNDPFTPGVRSLSEALRKRGIRSEFHLYEGGHSLEHNKRDFGQYLMFYADAGSTF